MPWVTKDGPLIVQKLEVASAVFNSILSSSEVLLESCPLAG
jgi:hypothetical protein